MCAVHFKTCTYSYTICCVICTFVPFTAQPLHHPPEKFLPRILASAPARPNESDILPLRLPLRPLMPPCCPPAAAMSAAAPLLFPSALVLPLMLIPPPVLRLGSAAAAAAFVLLLALVFRSVPR